MLTQAQVDMLQDFWPVLECVREACMQLEAHNSPTGVNMVFILNNMYSFIEEHGIASRHGAQVAAFARAVKGAIEARFNRDVMVVPCALALFDPKVGHLENMPKWWSKAHREEYKLRVEELVEEWATGISAG